MIANAAVVLPQPDSPTSPYDSPCADRERDAAQHAPVDAAHAVGDLEVLELRWPASRHRSKSCAIASAIRLMPTMSVAMASDGKSTGHQ